MTTSSSNISGKRLESPPPLQNFSKILPISVALIILGGFGLWVASQGIKTWKAKKASTQALAASFALTIGRLIFERLSNLWNARKQPPPQDPSSSLNIQRKPSRTENLASTISANTSIKNPLLADATQPPLKPMAVSSSPNTLLEFSQAENLTSKKDTLSAPSRESKDQLEKNSDLIPSEQQPLTSSSDLTSFPHTEPLACAMSVSAPVESPSSINSEQFPLKPITVSPLTMPAPKTSYEVPFYVTNISGGYIGDPSKFVEASPEFLDLTMEDGSSLPLDPHDFLVPISVFYKSCPRDVDRFPNPFYIPYNFLKDKENESTFTLIYKDNTFICTVNQYANHNTKMHRPFKDILFYIETYVKHCHQIGSPLYSPLYHPQYNPSFQDACDPTWFYQLGNQGSIFKMNHSRSQLEERLSNEFRAKNNPQIARGKVRLEKGRCTFTCLMSLINPENVDIILNDTFLILYARGKESSWLSQIPSDAIVHENLNPPSCLNEREWIFGISWDERPEFNQFELAQLKEKILQGTIRCPPGSLIFSFPLLESSPDKILYETIARN